MPHHPSKTVPVIADRDERMAGLLVLALERFRRRHPMPVTPLLRAWHHGSDAFVASVLDGRTDLAERLRAWRGRRADLLLRVMAAADRIDREPPTTPTFVVAGDTIDLHPVIDGLLLDVERSIGDPCDPGAAALPVATAAELEPDAGAVLHLLLLLLLRLARRHGGEAGR